MSHKKYDLLDSIINYIPEKNKLQEFGNRASHAISSIINLIESIENDFDEETSEDLKKRLILCIKNRDYKKFEKGLENLTMQERRNEKRKED